MARPVAQTSIYSIAAELGVSASMVSRALNNRSGVSEESRRKILQSMRDHGFKINYPIQHQPRIAIVLYGPSGVGPGQAQILTGINEYFSTHNITASTVLYDPFRQASLLTQVREQQCAGIIILADMHLASQLPELAECGLPVVTIDERPMIPGIGFVDNDSYSGAFELVEYLLKLGHRKIGFLLRWPHTLNHIQRVSGYRNAMSKAGIDVPKDWIIEYQESGAHVTSEQSGEELFLRSRKEHPDFTALVAVNDGVALGVLHAALRNGLAVPGDISIAGFDDMFFCAYTVPELTTVFHPSRQAGSRAAHAIAKALASNGQFELPNIILPTQLVIRQSTGSVPAR